MRSSTADCVSHLASGSFYPVFHCGFWPHSPPLGDFSLAEPLCPPYLRTLATALSSCSSSMIESIHQTADVEGRPPSTALRLENATVVSSTLHTHWSILGDLTLAVAVSGRPSVRTAPTVIVRLPTTFDMFYTDFTPCPSQHHCLQHETLPFSLCGKLFRAYTTTNLDIKLLQSWYIW